VDPVAGECPFDVEPKQAISLRFLEKRKRWALSSDRGKSRPSPLVMVVGVTVDKGLLPIVRITRESPARGGREERYVQPITHHLLLFLLDRGPKEATPRS
jgi:hypothetical protein